jgi:branched-chain amino acid transport system substrate-binding protein
MAEIEDNYKLPIVSHWSVTGSNFISCITTSKDDEKYFDISKVDLSFIQPSFIFNKNDSIIDQKLINDVKKIYPKINAYDDIQPPAGFVNAYDLTLILLEASKQAKLTGNVKTDKIKLHEALENLKNPVNGLIKTYDMPFSQYSKKNDDAHEALNENDFMMAKFNEYGKVVEIEEN